MLPLLFNRALILSWELNHHGLVLTESPPKDPASRNHPTGIRTSPHEFSEDTNIQTVAVSRQTDKQFGTSRYTETRKQRKFKSITLICL